MGIDWPPDEPREATGTFGDSVLFEDHVDAKIATPLHPVLLQAARECAERASAAAGTDPNRELQEACMAILAAAIAIETATHWAAETTTPGFLDAIQDEELARKWQAAVKTITGTTPSLGEGTGHAVSRLAGYRNRIAHNPSRNYPFFLAPRRKSGGRSDVRTEFTAARAAWAATTAAAAIRDLRL
ncbi:MAG: hypothetical protein H0X16_04405 [Chloroflexi bacterium]|nr:hypothetical protein [Chloroflexota bacterium]HEV8053612.1 hypothetical protein [Candidatus Limnocylindrales bacterium]